MQKRDLLHATTVQSQALLLHIVSVNISLIHMLIQCIKRMHVKYLLLKKVKQPGFEPLIPWFPTDSLIPSEKIV